MHSIFLILVALLFVPRSNDKIKSIESWLLNKENNIIIRGILSLVILFHHFSSTYEFPLSNQGQPYGEVVVSIFFFFSGYGIFFQYIKQKENYLYGFLSKRLLKILPSFIIISVFALVVQLTTDINILEMGGGKKGCIIIPNGWFVYASLFYYFAFFLIVKFFREPKLLVLLMVFISLIWMVSTYLLGLGDWWWKSCIAFNIGSLYALKEDFFGGNNKLYKYLLLTLIFCVLPYIFEIRTGSLYYFKIFENLFPLLLAIIPCNRILCKQNAKTTKYAKKIGKISYEIYLLHGIVIIIVNNIFPDIMISYAFLLIIIMTILLSFVINFISKKLQSFRLII